MEWERDEASVTAASESDFDTPEIVSDDVCPLVVMNGRFALGFFQIAVSKSYLL